MTAIALRMAGADFLKLRKQRWLVILALFLTLGILVIFYTVTIIQHASDPAKYAPAGGIEQLQRRSARARRCSSARSPRS